MSVALHRILLLGAMALLLGGCAWRGERCDRVREYQASRSIEPITVPEDLATPERAGRLVIPELPPPRGDAPAAGCLDRPPAFLGER